MSLEYSITRVVGNRRGQRKTRVLSPVMGQAGCPGWEPDCLKPAGTWVGVSARMYNDSNSLGDRAKEGRGSEGRHAGTGEGISAHIHVANSHTDRAEDGRKCDRRHSACGRGLTPACRWGPALLSHVLEVAARVCLSVQE